MALEVIEHYDNSPKGSFATKGDPNKERSTFAVIEGTPKTGWRDSQFIQQGEPTSDHRQRLPFKPWRGPKGERNIVHFDGMKLEEHVASVEDCEAKEKYEAGLSNVKCNEYLIPKKSEKRGEGLGIDTFAEVSTAAAHFAL